MEVAKLQFRRVKTDYVGSTSSHKLPDLYVLPLPGGTWLAVNEKGGIQQLTGLTGDPFPVSPPHIEELAEGPAPTEVPSPPRAEEPVPPPFAELSDEELDAKALQDLDDEALGVVDRIATVAIDAAGDLALDALTDLVDEIEQTTGSTTMDKPKPKKKAKKKKKKGKSKPKPMGY